MTKQKKILYYTIMPSLAVETYDKLRSKIGEESARTIIEYIDSKVEGTTITKLDLEKSENGLRSDINDLRLNLEKDVNDLRLDLEKVENRLQSNLEKVENKLRMGIQDLRWQIKLYFIITSALILFTNPRVLEIIGKIFKSVF